MPKITSWFPSMIFILCLLVLNSCKNKTSAPNLESLALPTFYPPEGLYNDTQYVVLSCITPNATIYYTSDNSEPGLNTEQYVNPIEINTGTTIKCKAYKDGYQASATAIATYMINVPDPPETFILVPGGSFHNGNAEISLSAFYIDRFELTQADYEAVMGINPSHFQDDGQDPGRPVERVSWFNAIEYCNRRSILEGLNPCYSYSGYGSNPCNWPQAWDSNSENHENISCNWSAHGYRLPTEMQWMFAAKGGNESHGYMYSGSGSIGEVAWYTNNSEKKTHGVGQKLPNEIGIYDMSGNVYEWCWDRYGSYHDSAQIDPTGVSSGLARIFRGGCWHSHGSYCRVANRGGSSATTVNSGFGFRLSRAIP